MATDVEIERSLNALSVTLNDQRLDHLDLERLQQIVTSALAGEEVLRLVRDAEQGGRVAWLRDLDDQPVGRIELGDGARWTVARCAEAQAGGHTPSPG